MKIAAVLTIENNAANIAMSVKAATQLDSGDIRLTVDKQTKERLSKIALFPVHAVIMVVGDFDYSLIVERKGATSKGMVHYEENSMCFRIPSQTEAARLCVMVERA